VVQKRITIKAERIMPNRALVRLGYNETIQHLETAFGNRLKTAVLFGSRARGKTARHKDHDIFLVIEDLPTDPLKRQQEIRQVIWELPIRINTIAKTPGEVNSNLTPLLLEICVDGICLYGSDYFEPYRKRAMSALNQSGLKRIRVGQEWRWQFEKIPTKEWEMTWEGFRELE